MLPTAGCFQFLPCPDFTEGQCKRPFCHFRHIVNSSPGHWNYHTEFFEDKLITTEDFMRETFNYVEGGCYQSYISTLENSDGEDEEEEEDFAVFSLMSHYENEPNGIIVNHEQPVEDIVRCDTELNTIKEQQEPVKIFEPNASAAKRDQSRYNCERNNDLSDVIVKRERLENSDHDEPEVIEVKREQRSKQLGNSEPPHTNTVKREEQSKSFERNESKEEITVKRERVEYSERSEVKQATPLKREKSKNCDHVGSRGSDLTAVKRERLKYSDNSEPNPVTIKPERSRRNSEATVRNATTVKREHVDRTDSNIITVKREHVENFSRSDPSPPKVVKVKTEKPNNLSPPAVIKVKQESPESSDDDLSFVEITENQQNIDFIDLSIDEVKTESLEISNNDVPSIKIECSDTSDDDEAVLKVKLERSESSSDSDSTDNESETDGESSPISDTLSAIKREKSTDLDSKIEIKKDPDLSDYTRKLFTDESDDDDDENFDDYFGEQDNAAESSESSESNLPNNTDEVEIPCKKRVARISSYQRPTIVRKNKSLPSPLEVMKARYSKIAALDKTNTSENERINDTPSSSHVELSSKPTGSKSPVNRSNVGEYVRPVLNVKQLVNPTSAIAEFHKSLKRTAPPVDIDLAIAKEKKKRIAHEPKVALTTTQTSQVQNELKKGPTVSTFKKSNNISEAIRQNSLDRLYTVLLKKLPPDVASRKAVEEEQIIHEKITLEKIYRQSVLMASLRLSKQTTEELSLTKEDIEYPDKIAGRSVYDILLKYIISPEEYDINGFPIPLEDGFVKISPDARYYKPLQSKRKGDNFICLNCSAVFSVDPDTGFPVMALGEKCTHHYGRLRRAYFDLVYSCCSKERGHSGCTKNDFHILDTTNDDLLEGFIETDNSYANKDIYALDCEMCYTTAGREMVRVTVVDKQCKTVYDELVKPLNPIIDYSTRFSGVDEKKLRHVTKTLDDVRRDLMKKFSKDTILVGHSLDNDLKVLKLIHRKVVDTSIVYRHPSAPVKKYALKFLAAEHAKMLIQEEGQSHDSAEDAIAAMKLMWLKIKEYGKSL